MTPPLACFEAIPVRRGDFRGVPGGFSARRSTYTPSHFCNQNLLLLDLVGLLMDQLSDLSVLNNTPKLRLDRR